MRRLRLISTDIQPSVINPDRPTLVGRERRSECVGIESRIAMINRDTAGQEGHRRGRPTVVLQRTEERIDVSQVVPDRSGIILETANEVVAAADECTKNNRSGR